VVKDRLEKGIHNKNYTRKHKRKETKVLKTVKEKIANVYTAQIISFSHKDRVANQQVTLAD